MVTLIGIEIEGSRIGIVRSRIGIGNTKSELTPALPPVNSYGYLLLHEKQFLEIWYMDVTPRDYNSTYKHRWMRDTGLLHFIYQAAF